MHQVARKENHVSGRGPRVDPLVGVEGPGRIRHVLVLETKSVPPGDSMNTVADASSLGQVDDARDEVLAGLCIAW